MESAIDILAGGPALAHLPQEKVLKAGWLEKRGKINTAYKSRWIVLTPEHLAYHKEKFQPPRGVIPLKNAKLAPNDKDGPESFQIQSESRVFYIRCSDRAVAEEWKAAISRVIRSLSPSSSSSTPTSASDSRGAGGTSSSVDSSSGVVIV